MRGVPDATGDQEDFWDDRFYQMVFGICLIWFLDVMSKTAIRMPLSGGFATPCPRRCSANFHSLLRRSVNLKI
jgi:hypothetical protein